MGFRAQTNSGGTLLHGLERVFDLVKTALRREYGVVGVVCVSELCSPSDLFSYKRAHAVTMMDGVRNLCSSGGRRVHDFRGDASGRVDRLCKN